MFRPKIRIISIKIRPISLFLSLFSRLHSSLSWFSPNPSLIFSQSRFYKRFALISLRSPLQFGEIGALTRRANQFVSFSLIGELFSKRKVIGELLRIERLGSTILAFVCSYKEDQIDLVC